MYKNILPEDFVINSHPLITPGGVGENGLLTSDHYSIKVGNLTGNDTQKFHYRQIANIVNGNSSTTINSHVGDGVVYILSINRKHFGDYIYPPSFSINGQGVAYKPSTVRHSGAGPTYKGGTGDSAYILYPEIGVAVCKASPTNIVCNSIKNITNSHVFIRARNTEFNYSTNPSYADIDGNIRFKEWVDNPVTYITTVGLYNDNGDLLAVAKVPKPIKKTFHDETLIQVQLDF